MLTDGERQVLCDHLRATGAQFAAAIEGISEAEWQYEPTGGAWSIRGIAEHVVVVETNVLARVRGPLLESPPTPDELRVKAPQRDRLILERIPTNRETKAVAGPNSTPSGRWPAALQTLEAFRTIRAQTLDYAANTSDDLRGHFAPHAALRDLDGYQWLLLVASHTARHVAQMEEVRGAPDFPRCG